MVEPEYNQRSISSGDGFEACLFSPGQLDLTSLSSYKLKEIFSFLKTVLLEASSIQD